MARTVNIALIPAGAHRVEFYPDLASLGDDTLLLEKRYTVTTAVNGTGSISLPTKVSGTIGWTARLPKSGGGYTEVSFYLGPGAAINLEDAIAAGTEPTSTVTDYVDAALALKADGTPGVKVYRALLTQTGTDAPVATVLENSLGAVVWSRLVSGLYVLTLVGAFPENKVSNIGRIGNGDGNQSFSQTVFIAGKRNTDDDYWILATGKGDLIDGFLVGDYIEILVYPS